MLATATFPEMVLPANARVRSATTSVRGVWLFSATSWALYVFVGWWLIAKKHYMINDAMAKTLTAQLMTLSRDPHLASMGYYWMPLPMFVRIPFVLVLHPLDQTILAGPIASGLMAALTLPVLWAIGRAVSAPRAVTITVVAFYALSPVTVFAAASGMAETTYGLFLALTILGYVRWMRDGGVNNLVFMAIAFAGATLSRFESMVLLPILAVVLAVASERGRRLPTVVVATGPAIAAMGLFTIASALITRDPFYWWTAAKLITKSPDDATWLPSEFTVPSLATHGLGMIAVMAPGAYAVLGGGLADRNRRWVSFGLLGLIVAQPIAVCAQLLQHQSWATPRLFGFVTPLGTACAALWLLRGRDGPLYGGRTDGRTGPEHWRRRFGYLTVALLPVGATTATFYLADPLNSACEGEYAFFRPLLGKTGWSDPVEPSPSHPVFASNLGDFEDLIEDLEPHLADGKIAAMDSLQGFPLLFTDHAKQFRVPEDRDFERVMSDPVGRVDYVIVLNFTEGPYTSIIKRLVQSASPEGSWQMVKENPVGTVYEWVPARQGGAAPTPSSDAGVPVAGR